VPSYYWTELLLFLVLLLNYPNRYSWFSCCWYLHAKYGFNRITTALHHQSELGCVNWLSYLSNYAMSFSSFRNSNGVDFIAFRFICVYLFFKRITALIWCNALQSLEACSLFECFSMLATRLQTGIQYSRLSISWLALEPELRWLLEILCYNRRNDALKRERKPSGLRVFLQMQALICWSNCRFCWIDWILSVRRLLNMLNTVKWTFQQGVGWLQQAFYLQGESVDQERRVTLPLSLAVLEPAWMFFN